MSNEQLTSEDLFTESKSFDCEGFDIGVEMDRTSIGIFQGKDVISLDVDDARALRDFLNEVLP